VPDPEFDSIGRKLNVAARAVRGLLDGVLAEAGLTFANWAVIAALHARGPVIQKELARYLDMIGPSVVERVDQLEQAGLVARSPVPADRRATLVALTDSGQALYERLHAVMRATETALTSDIEPADLEVTSTVLARLATRARELRNPAAG
jgi:MarR family transcriptional regulator, transcriptional regulator for hemolysin